MPDVILIGGLVWWFAGTYFGVRHRLRNPGGSGSWLGAAPKGVLYMVVGVASLGTIALAHSASACFAATDAGFGPFVFGAILCAMTAGSTLGAARA